MALKRNKWILHQNAYYSIKPDMFGKHQVRKVVEYAETPIINRILTAQLPDYVKNHIPESKLKKYLNMPIRAKNNPKGKRRRYRIGRIDARYWYRRDKIYKEIHERKLREKLKSKKKSH